MYVPIFEQDDNRFFFPHIDYSSDNESDAYKIGIGALFECILLNMKFTHEVMEIDLDNIPHVKADLVGNRIAIISGPLFDEIEENQDGARPKKKPKKGYWYEYFYDECVLCGAHHEHRYRVYDRPKPEEYWQRHHFSQFACDMHFM